VCAARFSGGKRWGNQRSRAARSTPDVATFAFCRRRPDGFIEFEFAIGDPELAVELMLPESAFHEFCLANEVIVLDPATLGSGRLGFPVERCLAPGF
jgi:hypothetical protein